MPCPSGCLGDSTEQRPASRFCDRFLRRSWCYQAAISQRCFSYFSHCLVKYFEKLRVYNANRKARVCDCLSDGQVGMLCCLGGRKGSDHLPIKSCCPRPSVSLVKSTENIVSTAAVARRSGWNGRLAVGSAPSTSYCALISLHLVRLRHFILALPIVWLYKCKPDALSHNGRESGMWFWGRFLRTLL